MFYTQKEFYDAVQGSTNSYDILEAIKRDCSESGVLSAKKVNATLRKIKKAVLARTEHIAVGKNSSGFPQTLHLGKIMRPWSIVPKLRYFRPPEGDFGVGVEIEYGFTSAQNARNVMYHIRNWKHVALDREGGTYGVEATFPPILYSKLSKRDKPFRYLDYLAANSALLSSHYGQVGTHVNVSAHTSINYDRRERMNSCLMALTQEQKRKYFNRNPYGYINDRSESAQSVGYVEMKLFNSTTCSITLRRYINIAVSLVKLLTSNTAINRDTVIVALEEGYNKRNGHPRPVAV